MPWPSDDGEKKSCKWWQWPPLFQCQQYFFFFPPGRLVHMVSLLCASHFFSSVEGEGGSSSCQSPADQDIRHIVKTKANKNEWIEREYSRGTVFTALNIVFFTFLHIRVPSDSLVGPNEKSGGNHLPHRKRCSTLCKKANRQLKQAAERIFPLPHYTIQGKANEHKRIKARETPE